MFRALLLAALVAIAAPAAAQPGAAPRTCTVDLIRVPDDVRPVIQEWVDAEPRCVVTLAVRVIPTQGGLYVIATEPSGRTRERLVPDGLTAAVLIASWSADDGGTAAPAPAPEAPPVAVAPVAPPPVTPAWAMKAPPVTPTWAMKTPPVTPDWARGGAPGAGAAPGAVDPSDVAPPAGSRRPPLHRLATVALTIHEEGKGLRGDIDLLRRWRLKLGVMVAWVHTTNRDHYDDLVLDDIVLAAQAGNELRFGRFAVRATLAAGLAITTGTRMDTQAEAQSMLTPIADAMITGGFAVSGRFELRAGMALTMIPQRINNGEFFWDRDLVPQVVIGLGYRGD